LKFARIFFFVFSVTCG